MYGRRRTGPRAIRRTALIGALKIVLKLQGVIESAYMAFPLGPLDFMDARRIVTLVRGAGLEIAWHRAGSVSREAEIG